MNSIGCQYEIIHQFWERKNFGKFYSKCLLNGISIDDKSQDKRSIYEYFFIIINKLSYKIINALSICKTKKISLLFKKK